VDHLQKVVWSEGMFLTPHHFQQWDRHYEDLLVRQRRIAEPRGWGLTELKINEDALANGEFIISRASGVLPDGLLFDVPDRDVSPKSRQIGTSFDSKKDGLAIYLGSPLVKPGTPSVRMDGAGGERLARYMRKPASVADANTGTNDREIASAVKDLRILFEGEPLDDFVTLKIATLGRTATGSFTLKENYIPPCLHIGASPYLSTILRRIVEILSTKSSELSKQRRSRSSGLVEFTLSEAASFWLLRTVNAALPPLVHCFHRSQTHPEAVYVEMARLAGELFTFASDGHPKDVPLYMHDDLSSTFMGLEEVLRRLLETTIATRCTPIPLEKAREGLYTGRVPDEQMLEKAQFYIAVMAGVPEEKVVREVPLKAKISSLDRVNLLIAQAVRGVPVKHLPTPPAEIPVQPGRSYFVLQKAGEHWDAVKSSRTMSIYIPPEFTGLKLELMAVKE
jgi:type VI secretion system protein ImpJ